MLNALKEVAGRVDEVIRQDAFPRQLQMPSLRNAVLDYPSRGGKRLRPAMLLWSCGALQGNLDQALPAAAAVEVFHNWTLVHDDIIDNDDLRRGVPTEHVALAEIGKNQLALSAPRAAQFGRDLALLAGDIQQGWADSLLLEAPDLSPELKIGLLKRLHFRGHIELVEGEARDVEFSYREVETVSGAELEQMIYGKTAALLRLAAELGGAIALGKADWENPQIQALGTFAEKTAMAFQLQDDYLGIFGNEKKFGKPLGSDLSERKATWLLLETLHRLPENAKNHLLAQLGKEHYSSSELEFFQNQMQQSGALSAVTDHCETLIDSGKKALSCLPHSQYKTWLLQLANYLLQRDI